MIAIVAISLIVVMAIAFTTVKSIDQVSSNQEGAALQSLSAALQNNIIRSRYIPGASDWALKIAGEASLDISEIATNSRHQPRFFLIDPNLQIGANGLGLPYSQTNTGSFVTNSNGEIITPVSPRVMILSSLGKSFPTNMVNGILPTAGDFSNIWNTADGALPSGVTALTGWRGTGDDLKVQRINLSPLFVHLQLANYLSGTNQGQYKIDGQSTVTVTTNSVNAYFIQNTVLTLVTNAPGTATNAELMLSRDFSFFYVAQVWRDVPYIPDYFSVAQTNASAANLANIVTIAANMFVSSPNNTNALAGATPTRVLNSMSNFMYYYSTYYAPAAASNGWTSPGNPYEPTAKAWQTAVQTNMNNLFNNITQGACTNGP